MKAKEYKAQVIDVDGTYLFKKQEQLKASGVKVSSYPPPETTHA